MRDEHIGTDPDRFPIEKNIRVAVQSLAHQYRRYGRVAVPNKGAVIDGVHIFAVVEPIHVVSVEDLRAFLRAFQIEFEIAGHLCRDFRHRRGVTGSGICPRGIHIPMVAIRARPVAIQRETAQVVLFHEDSSVF